MADLYQVWYYNDRNVSRDGHGPFLASHHDTREEADERGHECLAWGDTKRVVIGEVTFTELATQTKEQS